MKKIRILVAVALICSMCLCLCACSSIKKEDITGSWNSTYYYQGNEYACMVTLSDDGSYHYTLFKDGLLSTIEDGTYAIKGEKVLLYRNGSKDTARTFKAEGEYLVNNGNNFARGELDMSLFEY